MSRSPSSPIVLVTGANKGIGREIARQLATRGCRVVVTARDARRGRDATDQLTRETSGSLSFIVMDVADVSSIRAAANEFARQSERLDVLVNNAAILEDRGRSVLETTPDIFDRTMQTNVRGPMLVTQHFWRFLRHARGRIINVSSGAGSLSDGITDAPAYGISKTALNSVTHKLAAAGASLGIAVNSMCPGWVRTDMGGSDAERPVEKGAETAVWLALDAPSDLTGRFIRDKQEIDW